MGSNYKLELDDDDKSVISSLANVPYEQTYFLTLDADNDDACIIAKRYGDIVEIKPIDLDLCFLSRAEFYLFVERLKQVRDECDWIAKATSDYVHSKKAKEKAVFEPVKRALVYEFDLDQDIYQVVFTRVNGLRVDIVQGTYTNPHCIKCMYVIDDDSPTDEKAAEAHLKAYLLKKAGIKCDEKP